MATVTVYSATRMKKIEDETVISGNIIGDDLILETREGEYISAGNVRGPKGDKGDQGDVSLEQLNVVDGKADQAVDLANSATSIANSALTLAQSAQVIARGSHKVGTAGGVFVHSHWIDYSNGIRMQWANIEIHASQKPLTFVQHGSLYTASQLVYFYPGFGNFTGHAELGAPKTLPAVSIGAAQHGAFFHTWGQAENILPGAFTFRFWSTIPRSVNDGVIASFFASGYRTHPK